MRVLKWTVPVGGWHPVGSGRVLHVGTMSPDDPSFVQVWTLEDVINDGEVVEDLLVATVVGTGQDAPRDTVPIGTVLFPSRGLVWHVFRENMKAGAL